MKEILKILTYFNHVWASIASVHYYHYMLCCAWQAPRSITKPAVFVPSVLSTTQMNTDFSAQFKTPSASVSKTPFKLGQSRKSIVSNIKENAVTPANKSLLSTSS